MKPMKMGGLVLALFVLCTAAFFVSPALSAGPLSGKKVALVIAPRNFQDREYDAVKKALDAAGASVTVASSQKGAARGMDGAEVLVTRLLKEVKASDFDAVVFIGGPGVIVLWGDSAAQALARDAAAKKKPLGAICLAPVILARAGVLKGKACTVWPDAKAVGELKKNGGRYADKPVVTDGLVVTGNGPDAAPAFAQALVSLMK